MPDRPNLLTSAEVAELFAVDPKTVTKWAKAGRIAYIRTPAGHRRYPASQFARVIAVLAEIEARAVGDA